MILDKLKTLFEGKFRDLFSNNNFTFIDLSRNTTQVLEAKDIEGGKKLSIDLSKASNPEKQAIKKISDFSIQNEGKVFLTRNDSKKTKQLKTNLPKSTDSELLLFYKDKLNSEMYQALEMSLIVRNIFRSNGEIGNLKEDISFKFPTFGNNLCNLTSSNYFNEYFKELYNIMTTENNFNIGSYKSEIEWIVKELPYMVFINRHKSLEEFSGEVKFKLDRLKKYGMNKFKLHAIGKDNVEKSLKIAKEYLNDEEIQIHKEVNESETIATIIFNF